MMKPSLRIRDLALALQKLDGQGYGPGHYVPDAIMIYLDDLVEELQGPHTALDAAMKRVIENPYAYPATETPGQETSGGSV